jgi:hypothetical protein
MMMAGGHEISEATATTTGSGTPPARNMPHRSKLTSEMFSSRHPSIDAFALIPFP